jgi:hypothetical protein
MALAVARAAQCSTRVARRQALGASLKRRVARKTQEAQPPAQAVWVGLRAQAPVVSQVARSQSEA